MTITVYNGITENSININIDKILLNISSKNIVLQLNSVSDAEEVYNELSEFEYTDCYFECYFKPHYSQGIYVDNMELTLNDNEIICAGDAVRCA